MKLKDIATYCLHYTSYGDPNEKNFEQKQRYYWSINGRTYTISEIQTYGDYSIDDTFTNLIYLFRYKRWNLTDKADGNIDLKICLNLDHDVAIFNDCILVHVTSPPTDDEYKLFRKVTYDSVDGYNQYQAYYSRYYVLNLVHPTTGLFMKNLRGLFKDLIQPPVQPKPAKLTLDEQIDNLIDEIENDARTMAIKKLKRMLNERL